MNKLPTSAVLVVAAVLSFADADTLSVYNSAKTVMPLGLTPLYDDPVPGGFPVSYLETADTCHIDSARFDTANMEWAFVKSGSRSGWLQKSSVRPAYLQPGPAQSSQSRETKLDADARRRYRVVGQHPEWERRVVKSVREVRICLDMNEAQILGSWGEPFQKSTAFILGAGKQDVWLFKSPSGKFETVFLVKGRVVGWSE